MKRKLEIAAEIIFLLGLFAMPLFIKSAMFGFAKVPLGTGTLSLKFKIAITATARVRLNQWGETNENCSLVFLRCG